MRCVQCVTQLQVFARIGVFAKLKFDVCSIVEVIGEGKCDRPMNRDQTV